MKKPSARTSALGPVPSPGALSSFGPGPIARQRTTLRPICTYVHLPAPSCGKNFSPENTAQTAQNCNSPGLIHLLAPDPNAAAWTKARNNHHISIKVISRSISEAFKQFQANLNFRDFL
jgi:hypothetical protein